MKRNKLMIMTLFITAFLISSMIPGMIINTESSTMVGRLEIDKDVRKAGGEWKEIVEIDIGDIVFFRINVTYFNETSGSHWAYNLNITDILPVKLNVLCLEYVEMIQGPTPNIMGDNNEVLRWLYAPSFELRDGETLTLIFKTISVENCNCCNVNPLVNYVNVKADEQCTGQAISDADTAQVAIICPNVGITIDKKIWNYKDETWVDIGYGIPYEDVSFNITVENTGDCLLDTVYVNDTLSQKLNYADNAIPFEPTVNGQNLTWVFTNLDVGEKIFIEFDATLNNNIPNNQYTNLVKTTGISDEYCCPNKVTDIDSAIVKVRGMKVLKQVSVKNGEWGPWINEDEASNGDIVRFRILIYYYGYYTLYDIVVEDILPDGLIYDNNAIPEEPQVSGNTLTWELDEVLGDGQYTTVSFQAIVNCDECENIVNLANIVANECSGSILEKDDTAILNVVCKLTADAGGPYQGEINEVVEITASATGGSPPYIFEWDMNGDEEYDDETGKEITYSWDQPGVYTIYLKVTDDDAETAKAYATATITVGDNQAPDAPTITGKTSGIRPSENVYYTFKAADPDNDKIYLSIDWGDGEIEEWIGSYNSSEEVIIKHNFTSSSTTYTIKAKAKDIYGQESEYGTLKVTTPKNKFVNNPFIYRILKLLSERFPIISMILNI